LINLVKKAQAEISKIGLDERGEIMEIVTSWERKGKKEGKKEGKQEALEQVAINALRQGMVVDLIVQITGLTKKQVLALQAQLSQDS
jgi:predicted transposase YdaD